MFLPEVVEGVEVSIVTLPTGTGTAQLGMPIASFAKRIDLGLALSLGRDVRLDKLGGMRLNRSNRFRAPV